MSMKSSVSRTRKGSKSIKTIIPEAIGEILELQPGDSINWTVETKGGKIVIQVSRV